MRTAKILRDGGFSAAEIDFGGMELEHVDMFKPHGEWVGLSGDELDDCDEEDAANREADAPGTGTGPGSVR